MKILVDECLPSPIKNCLSPFGHECGTVREIGFGSKKNGELLALADGKWDVLTDERQKHQIPAKHGRAEDLHPDTLCKIQSSEGSTSPHTCVCRSSSFHPGRSSGRNLAYVEVTA